MSQRTKGPKAREATSESAPPRPIPRPRLSPLLVIFAVQALFLSAVCWLTYRYAAPVRVVGADAMVFPGEEYSLGLELSQECASWYRRDFTGWSVTFEPQAPGDAGSPGEARGPGTTAVFDSSGKAAVRLKAPSTPGQLLYVAKIQAVSGVTFLPAETQLLVQVAPKERPVVLVAASDELLTDSFPGEPPGEGLKALAALSKERSLYYVAMKPADTPQQVRAWLRARGLTPGPVHPSPFGARNSDHHLHVEALGLSRWQAPHWAIAMDEGQAHVFLGEASTLKVALFGKEAGAVTPGSSIVVVTDWKDALLKILGHP